MRSIKKQKEVLLGVTGGIAAYKAAEIVRLLQKNDCAVTVVMTENAKQFITPLTFESLTGRHVYSGLFDPQSPSAMEHIELSKKSDLLLIAPATANIIGKAAHGIADDLLSCLLMTVTKPIIIAPAMNTNMYLSSVVQENIACLRKRGVKIIGPEKGELACGDEGPGRLAEVESIVDAVKTALKTSETLKGKRILVTAGPTREAMDPVRFISNPSSGKMGFALAAEALKRGAEVTLISGPTRQEPLPGIKFIPVVTAHEMKEEVFKCLTQIDIVIMAAAVGDYRPVRYSKQKIKKDKELLVLEFKKTIDILAEIGRKKGNKILIGFAAETEQLIENAREKLKKKNLDIIVANKIGISESGFQSDLNEAVILSKNGKEEELPLMSKTNLAGKIFDMLNHRLTPTLAAKRKLSRLK
jgi:phosphopantothenoylcysteine decarboxylase/phosphopantothenate--cysteine ligase